MQIALSDLKNHDFQLSNIDIFHQKPVYRTLHVRCRRTCGFLFILHGTCQYAFPGGKFDLTNGSVVYLPDGSIHDLTITSPKIEFYRVDFQLHIGGEVVHFSDTPLKLCQTASADCAEAFQTLADSYQFVHDSIAKIRLLCTIFGELSAGPVNARQERLSPAIRLLLEHLTTGVDCGALAKACSLSTAQFYSLFRAEYAMTPLKYRDRLLMQRATLLLREGTFSITDVAEMLGFDNVSYFSRFFKKHSGFSPSEYLRQSE